MNNNIVVLQLGGQERTLMFQKLGFLKHLGELLGANPLSVFTDGISTDPKKVYEIHRVIIEAGLRAECDVKKMNYDDSSDVDRWVSCLDQSEIEDLVLKAFATMTKKTIDELKNVISQATTSNGTVKTEV